MNHLYKKIVAFKSVYIGFHVMLQSHLNGKGAAC